MRLIDRMNESIKRGIRSWLQIQPAAGRNILIQEVMDFELHAIRNMIWYRGDGNELEQMYSQSAEFADRYKFWASRCTPGMEMRKIHTGLPGLIVRLLCGIVLNDMNEFEFEDAAAEQIWEEIEKQNGFRKKLKRALQETLYIGDGAWKIVINEERSVYPLLRWYSGEKLELSYDGDDLREVIFKTEYQKDRMQYVLYEHYGHGYIHYELFQGSTPVPLGALEATRELTDWTFDKKLIMAVPMKVYDSTKYPGRGGSIFDGKLDSFDAFDEAWSQWMDALRAGRARTYVPESYIPRDPKTGQIMKPNPFDNRFISGPPDMSEGAKNVISTEQPNIPHDSYMASYTTALDLCLQGLISPSTLGVDVKKLDNAEAQREKEKATLYTRNNIIEALQEEIPQLISAAIHAYQTLGNHPLEDIEVNIPFGEYANPSFESQVETVAKGKQGGIMSIEASVDELYGDSKDKQWKEEEVARLKAEQGIAELTEPSVNQEGVTIVNDSESGKQIISDVPTGVSAAPESGQ